MVRGRRHRRGRAATRGGRDGRALRRHRRGDRERRRRAVRDARDDRPGRRGAHVRREPARRVAHHPRDPAARGGAAGLHPPDRLARGRPARPDARALRGDEGGRRGVLEQPARRDRAHGDARGRRLLQLHRHRHGAAGARQPGRPPAARGPSGPVQLDRAAVGRGQGDRAWRGAARRQGLCAALGAADDLAARHLPATLAARQPRQDRGGGAAGRGRTHRAPSDRSPSAAHRWLVRAPSRRRPSRRS